MATIEKSIDVEVPVSAAYDQWTQFEEFPKFMEGIVAVRQLDDSHVHWVAEIAGERQEWDAVNVEMEYEPDGIKESVGAAIGLDSGRVAGDLERFKDLVESRELPTGSWRGEVESGDVVADDPGR